MRAIAGTERRAFVGFGDEPGPDAVSGGMAVVAIDDDGLQRVGYHPFGDVSQSVRSDVSLIPEAISAHDDTVFVAQQVSGPAWASEFVGYPRRLDAVSVADPEHPLLLTALPGTLAPEALTALEGRLLAAGRDLAVFDTGPVEQAHVLFLPAMTRYGQLVGRGDT